MPDDSVPSCMIMPVRVASPHFVTLVRQSPPRQGQGDAHFHVRRLGRSSKSRRLRAVLHEHAGSCRIISQRPTQARNTSGLPDPANVNILFTPPTPDPTLHRPCQRYIVDR